VSEAVDESLVEGRVLSRERLRLAVGVVLGGASLHSTSRKGGGQQNTNEARRAREHTVAISTLSGSDGLGRLAKDEDDTLTFNKSEAARHTESVGRIEGDLVRFPKGKIGRE
jgi:hypothetical protein